MLAALKRKYRLNRNSSLVVAVAKGHTEMVRLLLESKADVSETNASGETILHIALLHKCVRQPESLCAHWCVSVLLLAIINSCRHLRRAVSKKLQR